jgi:GNAT superfamily N-acetyltransferase
MQAEGTMTGGAGAMRAEEAAAGPGARWAEGTTAGRVGALLAEVARGRFPPPDGSVTLLPQPSPRDAGVFGFTAHAVIFADTEPGWIAAQLPPGNLGAPMSPAFLASLAERTGRRVNGIDLLCTATALPGPPALPLVPLTSSEHPRVARARHYRDHVRVWEATGGVVLIGAGVAQRWEVAVEVDPDARGKGLGRELARAARHLIPPGVPLWAQVSPGNAASVRAFLAAGFTPAGAEALLIPPGT